MTAKELIEEAQYWGLTVSTWSPGDGVTRYRFHRVLDADYFSDNGVFTAIGKKAATMFLRGYIIGYSARVKEGRDGS